MAVTKAEMDRCYAQSAKGMARARRYRQSAKGRAYEQRNNAERNRKRLFIGRQYVGVVQDTERADAINAHIKERLSEFVTRQSARAQVEGAAARPVSAETEL